MWRQHMIRMRPGDGGIEDSAQKGAMTGHGADIFRASASSWPSISSSRMLK